MFSERDLWGNLFMLHLWLKITEYKITEWNLQSVKRLDVNLSKAGLKLEMFPKYTQSEFKNEMDL